jgi:hypothetical protein
MRIVDQRHLHEDNRYASQPCLLSILELDEAASIPPAALASLHQRLLAALPGLKRLRGMVGRRGASADGGNGGVPGGVPYLARLTQQVAIELQHLAGGELVVGFIAPVPKMTGRYRLVLPYRARHVAESALALATRLLDALLAGRSFDLADGLRCLRQPGMQSAA